MAINHMRQHIRKQPTIKETSKWREQIAGILIYIFLAAVALTCVFPFIHVFAKSVSEEAFVIANKVLLIPKGFQMEAYKKVFSDMGIMRSFGVSVLITVLFTVLGMTVTLCAAYPLSRSGLPGRQAITFFFMFTMYFNGGIIPEYLLLNSLGLLDSLAVLILPLAFSAYNFLIMKTSLKASIPESLIESAYLDGASEYRILWSIVMPLSKPIIATLSLFYAVGRWNSYSDALFYIKQNVDIRPLQLKLYYLVVAATEAIQGSEISATTTNPEVLKAACIMFATVPVICIYPFIQKYFVQGTMIGSVKE